MNKKEKKEPRVVVLGEEMTPSNNRQGRSVEGFVWGLLIIFAGIIFLLNTFELVSWDIWADIWRFWPLLVILAGVKIVLGNGMFSGVVMSVISALLIVSVLIFILTNSAPEVVEWVPDEIKETVRFWEVIDK